MRMIPKFRTIHDKSIILILALFFILGLSYSVIVPIFETPDEIGHFDYIRHIQRTGSLPVQRIGAFGSAHHAPLYYLSTALLTWPIDAQEEQTKWTFNPLFIWAEQGGQEPNILRHRTHESFPYSGTVLIFHLARLISVMMGTGTVYFVWKIGRELFAEPEIPLLAAILAASNPQFLFIGSAVSNDVMLALTASATIFVTLRTIKQPENLIYWAVTGVMIGLTALSKANGLLFGAPIFLYWLYDLAINKEIVSSAKKGMAVFLPFLAIAGWWFWRNYSLYGDLMGWEMFTEVYAVHLRQNRFVLNDLRGFYNTQYDSFWGVFGWMTIRAPAWFYVWVRGLGLVGLAGAVWHIGRNRYAQTPKNHLLTIVLLIGLLHEGYMTWAITRFNEAWHQGRFLFPILAPIMILLAIGLYTILPKKKIGWGITAVAIIQFSIAFYLLTAEIRPAYVWYTPPKASLWAADNPVNALFANQIALRNYKISQGDNQTTVSLTWEAVQTPDFNYSAFVHLLNENGELIAQVDQAPGEANGLPPVEWHTDDLITSEYVLPMTGGSAIRIGLYNWVTGERLMLTTSGRERHRFPRIPSRIIFNPMGRRGLT